MENTQPNTTNQVEDPTREPVPTIGPKPMVPVKSEMSALAALFQRWSEKCEQASQDELTPALKWWLKGASWAFETDALRARSLTERLDIQNPPPGNLKMAKALEIMVDMLCAMGVIDTVEEEAAKDAALDAAP